MADWVKLLKFGLVGTLIAALYVVLYALFLSLGIVQVLANGAAFLLAVAMQYILQARVTFDAPLLSGVQGLRFAIMVGCGLVTSAIITAWVGPALNWPQITSALVVTLVLPLQNYLIMSRWVFVPRAAV